MKDASTNLTHSYRQVPPQGPYATHLLEAGVTLRTIQQVLGHKSLRTTELYMHITQPGAERLQETLDRLMVDL
jgi:integrase/recombinase XerD